MICTPHLLLLGIQITEDMMDGACGMHRGEDKYIQVFPGET
jgi:hypothetical protein